MECPAGHHPHGSQQPQFRIFSSCLNADLFPEALQRSDPDPKYDPGPDTNPEPNQVVEWRSLEGANQTIELPEVEDDQALSSLAASLEDISLQLGGFYGQHLAELRNMEASHQRLESLVQEYGQGGTAGPDAQVLLEELHRSIVAMKSRLTVYEQRGVGWVGSEHAPSSGDAPTNITMGIRHSSATVSSMSGPPISTISAPLEPSTICAAPASSLVTMVSMATSQEDSILHGAEGTVDCSVAHSLHLPFQPSTTATTVLDIVPPACSAANASLQDPRVAWSSSTQGSVIQNRLEIVSKPLRETVRESILLGDPSSPGWASHKVTYHNSKSTSPRRPFPTTTLVDQLGDFLI